MIKNKLKFVNLTTALLLIIQAGTGMFSSFIDSEIFYYVHSKGGFVFVIFVSIHISLNWNWVKKNVFLYKPKNHP